MTISADYGPLIDSGNGVTTTFAVTFPFDEKSDLAVTLYDTVVGADVTPPPALNGVGLYDYTVTGTPDPGTGVYPSGTVTFNNAPLANHKVIRSRATPQRQPLALLDNARFPAKSVEGALDRLELQIQEIDDVASRAITVPPGDTATDLVLSPVGERVGQVLTFDDAGNVETTLDKAMVDAAIGAFLSGVAPAPTTTAWAATLPVAQALYPASRLLPDGQAIYVSGRAASFDGYQGTFVYKAGDTATVFPSNARGFVDNAGRRWWRWHPDGIVNVLWYGAWGDGSHNDYAPLQAAVDDTRGQGQSTVLIPRGIYLNDTQAWNFSGVSVAGFSRIGSILKRGPNMTDLYLWKLDSATSGGAAAATYSHFRSDGSETTNANANWTIGLIGNVLYNRFEGLDAIAFKTGALRFVLGSGRPNLNTFTDCSFHDGGGAGVDMRAGGMIEFRGLSVEHVGGSFFNVSGADEPCGPVLVENFWFEASGDGAIDGIIVDGGSGPSGSISFRHGRCITYGNAAGTAGNGFNLKKANLCVIDGIVIAPRAGASAAGHRKVVISANATNTILKRCNLVTADFDNLAGSTRFETGNQGFDRVTFMNGDSIPAGSTLYYGPGTGIGGGFPGARRMRWGGFDAIAGLYVDMGPTPGPGQSYSIGVMKGGAAVAGLETVLTDANGGTNFTMFSLAMTDADTIEIRVITSAGAAAIPQTNLRVTLLVYK